MAFRTGRRDRALGQHERALAHCDGRYDGGLQPAVPGADGHGSPAGAVVLVGTTGDKVEGGRLFYVERVFAGNVPTSPIVIAFKEGAPVGDCSYPMSSGVHLVIAPNEEPDGSLHADLATLQAGPASALGKEFIAQAQARYGDGVVPSGPTAPASAGGDPRLGLVVAVGAAAFVVWIVLRGRRRRLPAA